MKYFLIVGEASGDMHASALMRELKKIDVQADFCFLGGDLMLSEGGTMVQHYKNMAFMGIVNVVKNLGKILNNFNLCKKSIADFKPDVVVLIDYPGFNLKIAKYANRVLNIPVVYYIAPKLWAWKEYRIRSLKHYVNKTFSILPFETDFFASHGYMVDYVGNPTAEVIGNFLTQTPNSSTAQNTDNSRQIVALLGGSRKQEIVECLPKMAKMANYFPDFRFVAAVAPGIDKSLYQKILPPNVETNNGNTYDLLSRSKAAVVNSGTATLETALMNVPQVVVYHVIGGKIVPILRKLILKIPFVSLVNLIHGKEIVKELITPHFNEYNLKIELQKILLNREYSEQILKSYSEVWSKLGKQSASKNCAEKIFDYVRNQNKR